MQAKSGRKPIYKPIIEKMIKGESKTYRNFGKARGFRNAALKLGRDPSFESQGQIYTITLQN